MNVSLPVESVDILQKLLEKHPLVTTIVKRINQSGGTAYLVGGVVRDLMLNLQPKDLDIEIHNLTLAQVEDILRQYGHVRLVGKSFGVLRVDLLDVDWSLPREDSTGRKPEVTIDPYMGITRAAARRDVTMNTMFIDLTTFLVYDPYNGYEDIRKKVLRSPDITRFADDPLRFYRLLQFIGRFDMWPDDELTNTCRTMDLSSVSVERIETELYKLFTLSARPSRAFIWLKEIGRLEELFPQIAALIGIEQNPRWHPEGDVFEHTMQAVDAAAALTYATELERYLIVYAALLHDLGKVTTTKVHDGQIKSLGHEVDSHQRAQQLLQRYMKNKEHAHTICKLVLYHMRPLALLNGKAKAPAYKRLAHKLAPDITIQMLALLARADRRGRNPHKGQPLGPDTPDHDLDMFVERAQQANVFMHKEEPVLQGRDLLDIFTPGPQLGEAVQEAYRIQIEEGITDKETLRARIIKLAKKWLC
jgi:tRNA nucleotidyltransferase (CCA-adding enzyme)